MCSRSRVVFLYTRALIRSEQHHVTFNWKHSSAIILIIVGGIVSNEAHATKNYALNSIYIMVSQPLKEALKKNLVKFKMIQCQQSRLKWYVLTAIHLCTTNCRTIWQAIIFQNVKAPKKQITNSMLSHIVRPKLPW